MIRKSVERFSEKIMLNQESRARWRFIRIPSRSGRNRVLPARLTLAVNTGSAFATPSWTLPEVRCYSQAWSQSGQRIECCW